MGNASNTDPSQDDRHTRLHTARLTIGMFVENMPNEQQGYLSAVLTGAASAAQKWDVNLVYFTGGHLYHTPYGEFDMQRNILYETVTHHTVSGLIILGTIGTFAPVPEVVKFYRRYSALPVVKIGLPLEAIPTVAADEEAGQYDLMRHLIQDHHYRRIAFINNPENYSTRKPRYAAYIRALADHGIALDPNLVVSGDWTVRSGRQAADILLDRRRAQFEAIVASNDNMALGALEALQARGIQVPYEIALTGFDDTHMSRLAMPSLTTVRQPMLELGSQAVNMLLAQIAGEQIPNQVLLPTELVIRQSCGCPDPAVTKTTAWLTTQTAKTLDHGLTTQREQIVGDLAHTAGSTAEAARWVEQLLDAVPSDLESADTFVPALDEILRQVIQTGGDVTLWQDVISALRFYIQPTIENDDLSSRTEALWHQARVFIGEAARKELAKRQLQMDEQNILLRMFGQALATTFDVEKLLSIVAQRLPQLGIPGCYLALYEDPQPYEYPQPAPEWSRLVLAYNEMDAHHPAKHDKQAWDERRFRSCMLMPRGVLPQNRRYTMVVEPLYFQKSQIGFALLEIGPQEGPVYETLREQISGTLKGALLFQEQRRAEKALEEAYIEVEKQVQERTIELEQEISERKQAEQTQKTLIAELEVKNAELERFTYTVSHDLKSPLITIRGFLGFLEQDLAQGHAERLKDDTAHITRATDRMQQLLDDLLELSRIGRLSNPPETLSTAVLAREASEQISSQLDARGIQVSIASDLPTVTGDRTRLRELFENLIGNAAKFMGDQPQPKIEIGMRQSDSEPVFYVRDNGIGIEPQYHDKIFGLFEKLDPTSEGTGIGLAIVKRIVETHGGQIWVESEGLGYGSTLCFTLSPDASV
ncbi:MAG: substrate-binding domain-containing protein [Anaerolineae bacterium]|nr:substrate-binding domain-containing protein [Anaerolineae bacterium]